MTQAEREFNDILAFLKDYLNKPIIRNGDLWNYLSGSPREENPLRDLIAQTQIKVMESGIFHEGGLKGKILEQTQLGQVISRMVWPISNLRELLIDLTVIMGTSGDPEKKTKELISRYFDDLLKAFITPAALARLGGVRKGTIEKKKNEMMSWKEKIIKKIPKIKEETALKIAETLIAHLSPKTPDLTIAERTNELLAAFGKKETDVQTLRKKIAKIRRNQT
jgi:hypothetical protein